MCKTYGVTPDSSFIEDMDEYTWTWMYQCWILEQEESHKSNKDLAVFLGSFFNYEMAKSISKQDNPDFSSDDRDFEEATKKMLEHNDELDQAQTESTHRRRRRIKD